MSSIQNKKKTNKTICKCKLYMKDVRENGGVKTTGKSLLHKNNEKNSKNSYGLTF